MNTVFFFAPRGHLKLLGQCSLNCTLKVKMKTHSLTGYQQTDGVRQDFKYRQTRARIDFIAKYRISSK